MSYFVSFFVSHRSFEEDSKLEACYKSLLSAVNIVNGLNREALQINLREYQKGPSGNQTASTLEDEALKAPCIIFLIGDEMSLRQKQWYRDYLDLNRALKEKGEDQVELLVYWRKSCKGKRAKKAFEKETPGATFIRHYSNADELETLAQNDISRIANTFSKSLDAGKNLPKFEVLDGFTPRFKETGDSESTPNNKDSLKKVIGWFLIAVALVMLGILFWKQCSAEKPNDKETGYVVTVVDDPASSDSNDTTTRETVVPVNVNERSGNSTKGNKPIVTPIKSYIQNGYTLTGIDGDFKDLILEKIESSSPLRQYSGKDVQWSIQLSETKIERGIDDGDFFVDVKVSVTIINNQTGAQLAKLPLYKNGQPIGSSLSYEDAFIEAENEELALRIADGIVKSIYNEK